MTGNYTLYLARAMENWTGCLDGKRGGTEGSIYGTFIQEMCMKKYVTIRSCFENLSAVK